MMNFIFFDVMFMDELIPSIINFNQQCHYAANITFKILKSIQTFDENIVSLYINNSIVLTDEINSNHFLDNKY